MIDVTEIKIGTPVFCLYDGTVMFKHVAGITHSGITVNAKNGGLVEFEDYMVFLDEKDVLAEIVRKISSYSTSLSIIHRYMENHDEEVFS